MNDNQAKTFRPYKRRKAAELEEIAQDIVAGLIFTDRHVEQKLGPEGMPVCFAMLSGFQPEHWEWFEANKIHLIFEYMSEAKEYTITGLPIFSAFQYLDEHDGQIVWSRCRDLEGVDPKKEAN
jgi:hypothetical protein